MEIIIKNKGKIWILTGMLITLSIISITLLLSSMRYKTPIGLYKKYSAKSVVLGMEQAEIEACLGKPKARLSDQALAYDDMIVYYSKSGNCLISEMFVMDETSSYSSDKYSTNRGIHLTSSIASVIKNYPETNAGLTDTVHAYIILDVNDTYSLYASKEDILKPLDSYYLFIQPNSKTAYADFIPHSALIIIAKNDKLANQYIMSREVL